MGKLHNCVWGGGVNPRNSTRDTGTRPLSYAGQNGYLKFYWMCLENHELKKRTDYPLMTLDS